MMKRDGVKKINFVSFYIYVNSPSIFLLYAYASFSSLCPLKLNKSRKLKPEGGLPLN